MVTTKEIVMFSEKRRILSIAVPESKYDNLKETFYHIRNLIMDNKEVEIQVRQ